MAHGIMMGSSKVVKAFLGTTPIAKIFIGNKLVFPDNLTCSITITVSNGTYTVVNADNIAYADITKIPYKSYVKIIVTPNAGYNFQQFTTPAIEHQIQENVLIIPQLTKKIEIDAQCITTRGGNEGGEGEVEIPKPYITRTSVVDIPAYGGSVSNCIVYYIYDGNSYNTTVSFTPVTAEDLEDTPTSRTKIATRSISVTHAGKESDSEQINIYQEANVLESQHYKNTSGDAGDNWEYNIPNVPSISTGLGPGGGSAICSSSVSNTKTYYQQYTSGSYTPLQTEHPSGEVGFEIVTNGNGRFSLIGNTINHQSMDKNPAIGESIDRVTDTVSIIAYNIQDSTLRSAPATKNIVNIRMVAKDITSLTGVNILNSNGGPLTDNIPYTGGNIYVQISAYQDLQYTWSSGAEELQGENVYVSDADVSVSASGTLQLNSGSKNPYNSGYQAYHVNILENTSTEEKKGDLYIDCGSLSISTGTHERSIIQDGKPSSGSGGNTEENEDGSVYVRLNEASIEGRTLTFAVECSDNLIGKSATYGLIKINDTTMEETSIRGGSGTFNMSTGLFEEQISMINEEFGYSIVLEVTCSSYSSRCSVTIF